MTQDNLEFNYLIGNCMLNLPMEQRLGEFTHLHLHPFSGLTGKPIPQLPLHLDGAM